MIFNYKGEKFEQDFIPKCNLCGCDLLIKITKKTIHLIKCNNNECESNKGLFNKLNAFLPATIAKKRIELFKESISCNRKNSIIYWIKKGLTEDEAKEKVSEFQSSSSKLVKNRFIPSKKSLKKLGYSEDKIRECFSPPNTISHWTKKGYTEDEAKEKVSEFQSIVGKSINDKVKRGLIKKYTPRQLEYWIKKGLTEDEAKEKVCEFQTTFSKEKCIKKHGEIKGNDVFAKRQQKWTKSLRDNFIENGDGRSFQSQWAREIITYLCNKLNVKYPEKELYIYDKKNKRAYSYDFKYNNKIIEFNGNYWHANPLFFDKNDTIRKKKVKDIWNYDNIKNKLAENKGYDVLVVWEQDYFENKDELINKCYNFIENE